MAYNAGRIPDTTADLAIGDVLGLSLRAGVLSRIEDERDRVLIFAHVAIGIPLVSLGRQLGMSSSELASRIDTIIAGLRDDPQMADLLGDIHRAGRTEHYQALAFSLGLQEWFCAYCGDFMVQAERGRRRKTCSDRCRHKLAEDRQRSSLEATAPGAIEQKPYDAEDLRCHMTAVVPQPVEDSPRVPWARRARLHPQAVSRDRALLLLGFRCPIPLSPSDLAMLDVDDVSPVPHGLEVRLFRRSTNGTRYVVLPADADRRLCPRAAVSDWRTLLIRRGRTIGPLFVQLDLGGTFSDDAVRLTGTDIARVITKATRSAYRVHIPALSKSTPIPEYFSGIKVAAMG